MQKIRIERVAADGLSRLTYEFYLDVGIGRWSFNLDEYREQSRTSPRWGTWKTDKIYTFHVGRQYFGDCVLLAKDVPIPDAVVAEAKAILCAEITNLPLIIR